MTDTHRVQIRRVFSRLEGKPPNEWIAVFDSALEEMCAQIEAQVGTRSEQERLADRFRLVEEKFDEQRALLEEGLERQKLFLQELLRQEREELDERVREQLLRPELLAAFRAEAREEQQAWLENENKKAEERAKREKSDRWRPALFILVTLVAWWAIAYLADLVVTCIPGGAACRGLAGGILAPSQPMTWDQWVLLVLALLAALWVAKARVYSRNESSGK